ncbi:hypothetical protein [Vogesella sp. XCS3]|uniref:hypothetical protein n=1 Tax=Vogesella sp. XCS3 TaxID=2877939 RepID=UPI001D0B62E2|nr:hypothetical protein [Vogesella sp. XCS3]UDM18937.1 hypothetical protein LCH97_18000 [Vogesella sp. XCS3]
MSVSNEELKRVIKRAEIEGGNIVITFDKDAKCEGRDIIDTVKVSGIDGISPYPLGAIGANESLVAALDHDVWTMLADAGLEDQLFTIYQTHSATGRVTFKTIQKALDIQALDADLKFFRALVMTDDLYASKEVITPDVQPDGTPDLAALFDAAKASPELWGSTEKDVSVCWVEGCIEELSLGQYISEMAVVACEAVAGKKREAAPELYDKLKKLIAAIEESGAEGFDGVLKEGKSALAKADGKCQVLSQHSLKHD